MQSIMPRTILAIIVTAIIVGAGVYYVTRQQPQLPTPTPTLTSTQPSLETYSSEKYSFSYPDGYTVTPATQSFRALTVEKAQNKRVEIFQMKDFGDRPWGFSGTETQEDIDGYVPKETLTVGSGNKQYDVWLFYSENDNQTRDDLRAIFDSIVVE